MTPKETTRVPVGRVPSHGVPVPDVGRLPSAGGPAQEYLTALPDEKILAAELEKTRKQLEARK